MTTIRFLQNTVGYQGFRIKKGRIIEVWLYIYIYIYT